MLRTNFLALLAVLPSVYAHMSFFTPAMFAYSEVQADDGVGMSQPMFKQPKDQWWFRGKQNKVPQEIFDLPAGGIAQGRVACQLSFTEGSDPCPEDHGKLHAGTAADKYAILPENRMGCALAIAYKSNPNEVNPEDFVVFSVNYKECAFTPKVPFAVPAEMPPCPNGKCVCAWFWQGHSSQDEMYMIGFNCNVSNAKGTTLPGKGQIPVKCASNPGSCVKGPKQPLYWANDAQNIDYPFESDYDNRPQYTMKWGFQEGAQNDIFGGGAPAGAPSSPGNQQGPEQEQQTPQQTPQQFGAFSSPNPTPADTPCVWPGHCLGDACSSHDDCDHYWACTSGKCSVVGSNLASRGTGKYVAFRA